jgi:hypothetical protein
MLALNVANDPVHDAVAELGDVGDGRGHVFEERGGIGRRQRAGGAHDGFELIGGELYSG